MVLPESKPRAILNRCGRNAPRDVTHLPPPSTSRGMALGPALADPARKIERSASRCVTAIKMWPATTRKIAAGKHVVDEGRPGPPGEGEGTEPLEIAPVPSITTIAPPTKRAFSFWPGLNFSRHARGFFPNDHSQRRSRSSTRRSGGDRAEGGPPTVRPVR